MVNLLWVGLQDIHDWRKLAWYVSGSPSGSLPATVIVCAFRSRSKSSVVAVSARDAGTPLSSLTVVNLGGRFMFRRTAQICLEPTAVRVPSGESRGESSGKSPFSA